MEIQLIRNATLRITYNKRDCSTSAGAKNYP